MTFQKGDDNIGRELAARAPALIRDLAGDVPKRGRGRPKGSLKYDPAHYQTEIVARLCAGESLQMICVDDDMPSLRTVNSWLAQDSDFKDAVAGARAIGVNCLMDAAVNIAQGGNHSTGSIERDKLLVSVIRWIAEKRNPENTARLHLAPEFVITIDDENSNW